MASDPKPPQGTPATPRVHPFDEGHRARQEGRPEYDNPYAEQGRDRAAWRHGWEDAKVEAMTMSDRPQATEFERLSAREEHWHDMAMKWRDEASAMMARAMAAELRAGRLALRLAEMRALRLALGLRPEGGRRGE